MDIVDVEQLLEVMGQDVAPVADRVQRLLLPSYFPGPLLGPFWPLSGVQHAIVIDLTLRCCHLALSIGAWNLPPLTPWPSVDLEMSSLQSCMTCRSSFAGLAKKSAQPLCSPPASLVKCQRHQLKINSVQLQLEAKALLGQQLDTASHTCTADQAFQDVTSHVAADNIWQDLWTSRGSGIQTKEDS